MFDCEILPAVLANPNVKSRTVRGDDDSKASRDVLEYVMPGSVSTDHNNVGGGDIGESSGAGGGGGGGAVGGGPEGDGGADAPPRIRRRVSKREARLRKMRSRDRDGTKNNSSVPLMLRSWSLSSTEGAPSPGSPGNTPGGWIDSPESSVPPTPDGTIGTGASSATTSASVPSGAAGPGGEGGAGTGGGRGDGAPGIRRRVSKREARLRRMRSRDQERRAQQ